MISTMMLEGSQNWERGDGRTVLPFLISGGGLDKVGWKVSMEVWVVKVKRDRSHHSFDTQLTGNGDGRRVAPAVLLTLSNNQQLSAERAR